MADFHGIPQVRATNGTYGTKGSKSPKAPSKRVATCLILYGTYGMPVRDALPAIKGSIPIPGIENGNTGKEVDIGGLVYASLEVSGSSEPGHTSPSGVIL
jgi:hypothetical protein